MQRFVLKMRLFWNDRLLSSLNRGFGSRRGLDSRLFATGPLHASATPCPPFHQ